MSVLTSVGVNKGQLPLSSSNQFHMNMLCMHWGLDPNLKLQNEQQIDEKTTLLAALKS